MKIDQATEDRLREEGAAEDMLRWLRFPEAVRLLLEPRIEFRQGEPACSVCGAYTFLSHNRDCKVVDAWRLLKLPEFDEEIFTAHGEALMEDRQRSNPPQRARDQVERLNDWFRRVYPRNL